VISYQSLESLAERYPAADETDIDNLAKRYERQQQQEILEIAAIAADVSSNSILNLGLEPHSNPLLAEAVRLQYPHVDSDSLVGMAGEKLAGFANGIKGKYFEVLVADRLNGGKSLGELALEAGQIARIAASPTQTGWDLQIVNEDDGSVVEVLQLKATESMAYVNNALTGHPDIRVATTLEVDGVAENILQTDISNSKLEEVVQQYVDELGEDTLTYVLHQGAEWAFDAVPLIPAILVAIIEGKSVMVGRANLDEALQRGAR
jgi:hypothetical protein